MAWCPRGHDLTVHRGVRKDGRGYCRQCAILKGRASKGPRTNDLTPAATDEILTLSRLLEDAMPWERDELLAEIAELQRQRF